MATGSQPNVMNVDLAFMDQSRQDLQTVKCVVVGDTGVGKTRLVCARACNTKYSLHQLTQTHVSTVWAIDHYRKDKEILDRSWCSVDGIDVSLRIWDTFGYHDKDRRFAYGRADVVLLCYSVVRPNSLKSVKHHWLPEIRRLCGSIPIVMCGCQADLRYLYKDKDFIHMDKSPFFREILDQDVLTPDKGRAVAKEIGACYYETSVMEQYGIEEVFINCIRAALSAKRDKHFWTVLGSLKHIRHPLAQKPLLPKKPVLPSISVEPSQLDRDFEKLLESQSSFCDVIFAVRGVCVQAHKACLIVSSEAFKELFQIDLTAAQPSTDLQQQQENQLVDAKNGNSGGKRTHNIGVRRGTVVKDVAVLLEHEETSSLWSLNTSDSSSLNASALPRKELNHQAFKSIEFQECEDVYNSGGSNLQTVVTLCEDITPTAFQYVLQYLYTRRCLENLDVLPSVKEAAELLGLRDLSQYCANILRGENYLNTEVQAQFQRDRVRRVRELLIQGALVADVRFQLDDGEVAAHRAVLVARCDMMNAMFNYNFRESTAKTVSFPGVSCASFRLLQEYLYTDHLSVSAISTDKSLALDVIELANRLCLPRLMHLTEQGLVRQLMKEETVSGVKDVAEDVLGLLEVAQLHNANQLAEFCVWYICCNYVSVYNKHAKIILKLRPEKQILLHRNRWPPIWYLKEIEFFERCQIDEEREKPMKISPRRGSDDQDRGCLGFCSRRNRRARDVTRTDTTRSMYNQQCVL